MKDNCSPGSLINQRQYEKEEFQIQLTNNLDSVILSLPAQWLHYYSLCTD